MRILLPTLAVVVGLANALLYDAFGGSPWGGPFVWGLDFGPMFTVHMLSAVLAGLIVSGALLPLAERKLREGFLARCGFMLVGLCAGGAILGVFLHGWLILLDESQPMPQGLEILYTVPFLPRREAFWGLSRECIYACPWHGCWGCSGTVRPRG